MTSGARRGRPPKSDEAPSAERLLIAAGEACAELGFERVTLEAIGKRVGLTPAAIYNHFGNKDELLYAAGLDALQRLTAVLSGTELGNQTVHDIAAAYLLPEMATTRRLFLELHLAGSRHPELAEHLDRWHAEWAKVFADLIPSSESPEATVKVWFLLLLGLCHIEELSALPAEPDVLAVCVDRLVDALFPPAVGLAVAGRRRWRSSGAGSGAGSGALPAIRPGARPGAGLGARPGAGS